MSADDVTPEQMYTIVVNAVVPDSEVEALFDRVAAAAHEFGEDVACFGGYDVEARLAASALREAAESYGPAQISYMGSATGYVKAWLLNRADRIEGKA